MSRFLSPTQQEKISSSPWANRVYNKDTKIVFVRGDKFDSVRVKDPEIEEEEDGKEDEEEEVKPQTKPRKRNRRPIRERKQKGLIELLETCQDPIIWKEVEQIVYSRSKGKHLELCDNCEYFDEVDVELVDNDNEAEEINEPYDKESEEEEEEKEEQMIEEEELEEQEIIDNRKYIDSEEDNDDNTNDEEEREIVTDDCLTDSEEGINSVPIPNKSEPENTEDDQQEDIKEDTSDVTNTQNNEEQKDNNEEESEDGTERWDCLVSGEVCGQTCVTGITINICLNLDDTVPAGTKIHPFGTEIDYKFPFSPMPFDMDFKSRSGEGYVKVKLIEDQKDRYLKVLSWCLLSGETNPDNIMGPIEINWTE